MKTLFLLLSLYSLNTFAAPVNINTADAQSIADALAGIGIKKAEAIVNYRKEKGIFKSTDELIPVKGIGKKLIEKNKADILLNDSDSINQGSKR